MELELIFSWLHAIIQSGLKFFTVFEAFGTNTNLFDNRIANLMYVSMLSWMVLMIGLLKCSVWVKVFQSKESLSWVILLNTGSILFHSWGIFKVLQMCSLKMAFKASCLVLQGSKDFSMICYDLYYFALNKNICKPSRIHGRRLLSFQSLGIQISQQGVWGLGFGVWGLGFGRS